MSLINQMLRDLEERRSEARSPAAERALSGLRSVAGAEGRRGRRGRLAGVALLATALAAGAHWGSGSQTDVEPADIDVAAPPQAPMAAPVETLAPKASPEPERRAPEPVVVASTRNEPPAPAPRATSRANARRSSPPPRDDYRHALSLAERGDAAGAIDQLERILETSPGHRPARAALATLMARDGHSADAIRVLVEGRRRLGDPTAFVPLEARLRADRGEVPEAAALLEGVPQVLEDPETRALLATLYQRQGLSDRAASLFSDALRRNPEPARWWLGLGLARDAQGRPDDALSAYRIAARRDAAGDAGLGEDTRRWLDERIEELSTPAADETRSPTP